MTAPNYLLIIDFDPINQDLIDYFANFKLEIVQQSTLFPIHIHHTLPKAILINWTLLKDAIEVVKKIYHSYPVPLLIINNSPNEKACITALESGADDFIIKPLYPRELHARITAINRRVTRHTQMKHHAREVLRFTNWKVYPASRQVFNETNQELLLSAGEYDLLLTFIQQPQQVLNREHLLHITKNSHLNPFDRRIDVQISRLRQKIETDKKKPALIKTIRNGGYIFTAPVISMIET